MPVGRLSPRQARLFVDVQHGLCNRLRALVSAAVIARRTGRELVVIWLPDHHCDCRISDLLDYTGVVVEEPGLAVLCRQKARRVYNYMEVESGARFEEPVLAEDPGGDIYVRSAYTLVSPHRSMEEEQEILRGLVPSAPVRRLVESVRRPNAVAVHVRMGTGPGFDHLSYEAPGNWPEARHRELIEWRQKSDARHFIARLDALIAEGRAETIFLAADLPQTYAAFIERYESRMAYLPRDLYDRSARQLQYALADLLLLTAAPLFLASTWSSFSDLAQRLARPGRPFERSGTDF